MIPVILIEFADPDGEKIWVNPALVAGVAKADTDVPIAMTSISFITGSDYVRGTPEEVVAKLTWRVHPNQLPLIEKMKAAIQEADKLLIDTMEQLDPDKTSLNRWVITHITKVREALGDV